MKILTELDKKQKTMIRFITSLIGIVFFLITLCCPKLCLGVIVILAFLLARPDVIYVCVKTVNRDLNLLVRTLKVSLKVKQTMLKGWSVARVFQEQQRLFTHKTCLELGPERWSFNAIDLSSSRLAAYFKCQGFKRGDVVALFMETKVEFVCFWLGLNKIGVISAWLDFNMRRSALLCCLKIANAKAIIASSELLSAIEEIRDDDYMRDVTIYQESEGIYRNGNEFQLVPWAIDLTRELRGQYLIDLTEDIKAVKPLDTLCYIFTSGTTGMPKAAVITNLRYIVITNAVFFMNDFETTDKFYCPLPLYHMSSSMGGLGCALMFGCTTVICQKFSVTQFWKDVRDKQCNVVQYIGEQCRYLLSAPFSPQHHRISIKCMFGNGMRPEIWQQFATRFNVQQINESYGSTEGNVAIFNFTGHMGAIGFTPQLFSKLFPARLIKCDEQTGEPMRDSSGLCIQCRPGETGLFVGKIMKHLETTFFRGYADPKQNEKSILRDVLRRGDMFFSSGDLMVLDMLGYFYFVDRIGDSFCWRNKNVSTAEVEAIIVNIIGFTDCVVFGVQVPHTEGRAGMAAICDRENKIDISYLSVALRGSLASYAQPLFIRLLNDIPRTGTYKLKKRDLMREGFDINKVKDPIYFLHQDGTYRLLDQPQYEKLLSGQAGL